MFELGKEVGQAFSDFLKKDKYDDNRLYVRALNDQPSIVSAYSFLLGIFPDALNGLEVHADQLDGELPVESSDIDSVRPDIGLQTDRNGKYEALDIFPGNKDHVFVAQVFEQYPSLKNKVVENLKAAEKAYLAKYGDGLFKSLATAFGKGENDLNFQNSLMYLDDYFTAQNNKKDIKFTLDASTKSKLQKYYEFYFKDGFLKEDHINEVFSHAYLSQLLAILNARATAHQSFKDHCSQLISNLRVGLFTGNHLSVAAVLRIFEEDDIDYTPSFASGLAFKLFVRGEAYWVQALYDGEPLKLQGKANNKGEISLEVFSKYIWEKLYKGDVNLVSTGGEDPFAVHHNKYKTYRDFLSKSSFGHDEYITTDIGKDNCEDKELAGKELRLVREKAPVKKNVKQANRIQGSSVQFERDTKGTFHTDFAAPLNIETHTQSKLNMAKTADISIDREHKEEFKYNLKQPVTLAITEQPTVDLAEKKFFSFKHLRNSDNKFSYQQLQSMNLEQSKQDEIKLAEGHGFELVRDKRNQFNYNFMHPAEVSTTSNPEISLA